MMKYLLLLIVIISNAYLTLAQISVEEMINEGRNAIHNGHYDSAIVTFKYILEKYPKDEQIIEVYYFLGYSYCKVGQFEKQGKDILEQLLNFDTNNNATYVSTSKHSAAIQLYKNFKERKVYDSALKWRYLADTVYMHWPVCGTDYESTMSESREDFLEIFRVASKHNEHKKLLLRTALTHYTFDTTRVSELRRIFSKQKNINNLKREFDDAVKHYSIVKDAKKDIRPCFTCGGFETRVFIGYRYITFQGASMYIDKYTQKGKSKMELEKESRAFASKIESTAFYKMLQSL